MRTVNVTVEDIAAGEPWNCFASPVGFALARRLDWSKPCVGAGVPSVGYDYDRPRGTLTRLPLAVLIFSVQFDRGLEVEPFSFDLPDPA